MHLRSLGDGTPDGETLAPQVRLAASDGDPRASLCLLLLIATLWLATRPYMGVIHDARFYTVQALGALTPGRFDDDLYFRFGSQDQFTIFTLIYRPVLAAFGIAKAAMILTIAGQCAWIGGLAHLARAIFRDSRTTLLSIAMAIALPGGVMFSYAESFLTPRLFAEAITLWALGSMLRGQPLRALLLLGLATTIHPIMTVPGLAVLFVYELAGRRVWWALGGLAVFLVLGLAYWRVQPFVRLLESFDPAWFAIVRVRDFFSLLTQWTLPDWLKTCAMLLLSALALSVADQRQRRFLVVALGVAVGGLAATLLGDLLRNVLLVDAQQYRATWLLAVTANLFMGPVLLRTRANAATSLPSAALALAIGMLIVTRFLWETTFNWLGFCVATVMLAYVGAAFIWEQQRQRLLPTYARLSLLIIVGVCSGAVLLICYLDVASMEDWPSQFWSATVRVALMLAALAAVVVCATIPTAARRAYAGPLTVVATVMVAVAAFGWDQRSPWTKLIETADAAPPSLISLLPDHKAIYWEGDVRVPWFLLKRPSYVSCAQGTGALFFRDTAMTYQHRYAALMEWRALDFGQESACPTAGPVHSTDIRRADIAAVCAKEPELGAVVLTRPATNAAGQIWISPASFEEVRPVEGKVRVFGTDRFFVYSCAGLQ